MHMTNSNTGNSPSETEVDKKHIPRLSLLTAQLAQKGISAETLRSCDGTNNLVIRTNNNHKHASNINNNENNKSQTSQPNVKHLKIQISTQTPTTRNVTKNVTKVEFFLASFFFYFFQFIAFELVPFDFIHFVSIIRFGIVLLFSIFFCTNCKPLCKDFVFVFFVLNVYFIYLFVCLRIFYLFISFIFV